jgi:hypothetical protein
MFPGMSRRWINLAGMLMVVHTFASAGAAPPPRMQTYKETLSGIQAIRELHFRKRYEECEFFASRFLWNDIRRQPEALYLLASSIDWQERPDEAAAWYTLYLRCLDEKKDWPSTDTRYRKPATNRLKLLKLDAATLDAQYKAVTADGLTFTMPEAVDDAWMTQVRADLQSLHRLRFYKAIRARLKGMPDNWIHNRQGEMHRSGMKFLKEVEGRNGVLSAAPHGDKDDDDGDDNGDADGEAHEAEASRITAHNFRGAKFLRIGARADEHPFELRVNVADNEIARHEISPDAWSDLKIALPPADPATQPSGAQQVTLQLVLPENPTGPEGAWFDYIEFFDN